jgi:hypothetical protein
VSVSIVGGKSALLEGVLQKGGAPETLFSIEGSAMAKQIEALELDLTSEEEAAAQRIYGLLKEKADRQLMSMARMLAAKRPEDLLGRGEFELRDMLFDLGAQVLEAGAQEGIKKGGASS